MAQQYLSKRDLRKKSLRSSRVIASLIASLMFSGSALAQSSSGRILGTVHDQTGAAIPNATVQITDVQRGISRTVKTDDDGEYIAPNLGAGTYLLQASGGGFKTEERTNVLLQVAQDLRIDFSLAVGEVNETVVSTADIPQLDSTTSRLGQTISNQTINDIPLNGRNYQNLMSLSPGIENYPGGGPLTHSSNGIRPEDNVYLVDGLENVEPFNGNSIINSGALAGDAATILPIDAIQEFNVEVNPSAEYGWKPGAVVNVGVKSGANSLHGTAYAFGRGDSFDARNYYNPAPTPKTPLELEQFGATAGGSIVKNKLFYFGAYESQRYTVGNSYGISAPETIAQTAPDPANSMVDAITALQAASYTPSPVSLKVAGCTLGPPVTCTGGAFAPNATNSAGINLGFPNTVSGSNYLAKIDYHLSENNLISGMYFIGDSNGTLADKLYVKADYLTKLHTRAQVAKIQLTSAPTSRWTNEVRFGYSRFNQPVFPSDQGTPATTYGINTGITNPLLGGLPSIALSGFTALGNGANHPKIIGPDEAYDAIDNVSYLRGNHVFKFGAEVRKYSVTQATYRAARGTINFSKNTAFNHATALEDFFAGLPQKGSIQVGDPTRNLSQWSYAAFFQDDWRVFPRITLNLGLRYEFSTAPSEANDLLGNFDSNLGLVQVGRQISSAYKPDHLNFSPRMGVIWDTNGKGTTIIRAGASIIYDTLSMDVFLSQQQTNNAPTPGLGIIPTGGLLNGVQGSGTINAGAVSVGGSQMNWNGVVFQNTNSVVCNNAAPCSILGMDRNYRSPYVTTWTLNVQHAFSNNLSAELAYVGNHAERLPALIDLNQTTAGSGWTPAAIAAGSSDTDAEQAARPFITKFPYLQFINQLTGIYRSNYNGLQATFNGRNYHGFSFQAAYTFSHSLDQSSENWEQYTPQDSLNPAAEYGNSDWDIRQRFSLATIYNIPGHKMRGQLLEGYQLNSLVSLSSGAPWTVTDVADDMSGTGEYNDRWNFFGKASDFRAGAAPFPYSPGASDPACVAKATTPGMQASLQAYGCYERHGSVLIPSALGTYGTMARNVFRDSGFHDWDLSLSKKQTFGDHLSLQFRAEVFNILNHPNFANPLGASNDYGEGANADPSDHNLFGCGCATPDVAAANPVLGTGSNRAIQLGLKAIF